MPAGAAETSAYDFSFPAIDGGTLSLSEYEGRPLLIVNTASQCGFTPQYDGLQALYDSYGDKGLVVIGIPSNDFGKSAARPPHPPYRRGRTCSFHRYY